MRERSDTRLASWERLDLAYGTIYARYAGEMTLMLSLIQGQVTLFAIAGGSLTIDVVILGPSSPDADLATALAPYWDTIDALVALASLGARRLSASGVIRGAR